LGSHGRGLFRFATSEPAAQVGPVEGATMALFLGVPILFGRLQHLIVANGSVFVNYRWMQHDFLSP
jgi:hypothetical protein